MKMKKILAMALASVMRAQVPVMAQKQPAQVLPAHRTKILM